MSLFLLIVLAPTWVAGYTYHMLGYRKGGRYDQ